MKRKIITKNYYIKTGRKGRKKAPLHLALVTDLHDRNPVELLRKLRKEKPDLILIAGDTMERHEEGVMGHTMKEIDSYQDISPNWSRFCRFLKFFHHTLKNLGINIHENKSYGHYFLETASHIAPVYMSVGNHEWYFLPEDYQLMDRCKITLLDNEDTLVTVKNRTLRIGGLSTRYDLDWLGKFSQKDGDKILLCHHPEYYKRFVLNDGNSMDLVCAGHAHGGQWRIFGRGILAPAQGFLPIFHHGRYSRMIVSAGVSNPSLLPRFGNPCELVMIHLY